MKQNISVVINTKNAASTIETALTSVSWADEIIVMDMQSSDDTKKIAKKYTKFVFNHEDVGYVEPARNAALAHASHEWILLLDADERVSDDLSEKIPSLLEAATKDGHVCVYLPRKNYIFGAWLRHTGWWPDYLPRLFKKGSLVWPERIHALPHVKGSSFWAPASEHYCLEHTNYTTIEEYVARMNRYTSIAAQEDKKHLELSSPVVFSTFFAEFLQRFFLGEGYRDGVRGSSLSLLQSCYQLLTLLKVWEHKDHQEKAPVAEEAVASLQAMTADLHYWIADFYVQRSRGIKKIIWMLRRKYRF